MLRKQATMLFQLVSSQSTFPNEFSDTSNEYVLGLTLLEIISILVIGYGIVILGLFYYLNKTRHRHQIDGRIHPENSTHTTNEDSIDPVPLKPKRKPSDFNF